MAETAHTPGPWKLLAVGDNKRLCPADKDNQSILTIEEEGTSLFACVYEEGDAHLIAAAPDLLEAIQAVVDYGAMTGASWVIEKATAAIAKAEGRS
jgi:hypothetical protein